MTNVFYIRFIKVLSSGSYLLWEQQRRVKVTIRKTAERVERVFLILLLQSSVHDDSNRYETMMMIKMIIVKAREKARKKARIALERVSNVFVILVLCHNSCKDGDNGNKKTVVVARRTMVTWSTVVLVAIDCSCLLFFYLLFLIIIV